jgi:hypothetical protein
MKKLIFTAIIVLLSLSVNAQLDTINVGTGPNSRNGDPLRSAFLKTNRAIVKLNDQEWDSAKVIAGELYIYTPTKTFSTDTLTGMASISPRFESDRAFIMDNVSGKKSRTRMFLGLRNGGDSIFSFTTIGATLNAQNQLLKDYGVALGNGSVTDGYMGFSAGTQSIGGCNDGGSIGNETVTGKRKYFYEDLTFGNDGGGNYIEIAGTNYNGDQSPYFWSAVDSVGLNWASRNFWNYPYFWTNYGTTNYPTGSTQNLGLNPLYCTGVSYDAGTDKTKIYYSDLITAPSAGLFLTSCSKGVPGTGNFAAGRMSSTISEAAISLGYKTQSWNTYAFSTGYNTKAWGSASASFNEQTKASGQDASSFGYLTTASGAYSSVFGNDNLVSGAGSVGFGIDLNLSKNYQIGYNSVEKFSRNGDIQAGLFTAKAVNTGAGAVAGILFKLDFNTTYKAITQYTIIQTTNTVGEIGESGGGNIDWTIWLGKMYVIDSINLTSNRIYFNNTQLVVGSKIAMNTYTTSAMTTETSCAGGLAYNQTFYIREVGTVGDEEYVTLAPTSGGTEVNITSFNASHYHTFAPVAFIANTQTSTGRNFVNDGDDVGNGTSTGIRCILATTDYLGLSRYQPQLYLYSLANRTVRMAATTNYVQIASE